MASAETSPPGFWARRNLRKKWSGRALIWAGLAALGLLIVANLPLVYSIKRFNWTTFTDLWKLAPHQYFFTLFCIPVAVWLTCIALWWVLRAARVGGQEVPERWRGFVENWPVVFLVGIAIGALVSVVFFVSSTWSPDKLRDSYPAAAVTAITTIGQEYSSTSEPKKVARLDAKKAQAARDVDAMGLTYVNVDAEFAGLSNFQQAQVLLTKESQTDLKLRDEAAVALSAFQVMAVVSVAVVLLLTCGLLLLLGHYTSAPAPVAELQYARLAIVFAICAFIPYPYLFGLYRSELERAVRAPDTGGQELVAMVVIILAAVLVMVSQPQFEITVFSGTWAAVIALVALVGTVAPKVDSGGVLRQLIGFQSTIASQFVLVIVWSVLALVAVVFTWPKTP